MSADVGVPEEYYDLVVRVADMPYPDVDYLHLLNHGLVSFSDSDALRDICGRVVRVLAAKDGKTVRVRFLRIGDSYRTRMMVRDARDNLPNTLYQSYSGVLHGSVEDKTSMPTRVVIVSGATGDSSADRIRFVNLDDP